MIRLSETVEWALHSVTLLALLPAESALPTSRLAEFHGVRATYLAKAMQSLAREGIVEASVGRHGGYRLGRAPEKITVLEVVEAVEGTASSFRCTEIRRDGPARVDGSLYSPICAIAEVMYRADRAWRDELNRITLADLLARLSATVPSEALLKGATWFQEIL